MSGFVMAVFASPPLPNPPDRSNPANTVNGPLKGPGLKGPYTGGVLVKTEAPVVVVSPASEPVAEFDCAAGTKTIMKTFPITTGMSLSGPLSNSQTSGVIEAFNDVKPKDKTVTLTATVSGDPTLIITYTLTGITYTRTIYDVYVITQAAPAIEQLAGFIVVDTPKSLQIDKTSTPCANTGQPMVVLGKDWHLNDTGPGFFDNFFRIFILPDDGLPPFFDYGKVYIYSGGSIYGGTDVRPGETVTFEVAPGTYTVSGDIGIFGIHISIPGQTVSPPAGQNISYMVIYVTLVVEEIIYIIIIIIVVVIIVVIYFIVRFIRHRRQAMKAPPKEGMLQKPPASAKTPSPQKGGGDEGYAGK
ncbi:MAG: hypothetical protein OK404_01805 [Thaumarchaeota archaeon]|nr:hypothetical protein [Nitrososphaerota archaeon]